MARAGPLPFTRMRSSGARECRSFRRVLATLAIAALAASNASCSPSLTSPSHAHLGSEHYGIVTQTWSPEFARWVGELGTGWVRLDFNWFDIEPSRGVFDWSDLDMRVASVSAQGLRVYATLAYTPAWAGPCRHCMPDDPADWRNFVRAVLSRYRDAAMVFGIWNEPNLAFLNDTGEGSAYALLFREANAARLLVDPALVLAGPETSHHAWPGYYEAVMPRVRQSMRPSDIVSVHYYPDAPLALSAYMQWIQDGAGGHPVWLTETGTATCDDGLQQRYLAHVLDRFLAQGRTWWPKTFVYVLYNGDSMCGDALIAPDGRYRASFLFYRDFIRDRP